MDSRLWMSPSATMKGGPSRRHLMSSTTVRPGYHHEDREEETYNKCIACEYFQHKEQ